MNSSTPSAKTIQIYLPKGNPRGLRIAEMTTRTVRLIEIPRIHINDFFAMPEANQVGLYFLISDTDSVEKPQLYIGQTGDLKARLNQHHKKEFWTRAFVMLSTNNTMTQTHALYMEHKAIATAIEVGRYEIKNGNNGNRPHTPDPLKADCEELFYTLDVLLSTLGQPIFETLSINNNLKYLNKSTTDNNFESHSENYIPLKTQSQSNENNAINPTKNEIMLFYCNVSGGVAQGYYNDDGFVLLAGSLIRKKTTPTINKFVFDRRSKMLVDSALVDYDNNFYKLVEDQLFKSPSSASQLVTGRSTNGWITWKNVQGKDLNSIYR